MTREEFLKGMTFMAIAYNKEVTEEQVSVWYDFFREDNYETFRNAVKRVIVRSQFMPSIAELKQEITLLTNPSLQLNAEDEWDNVLKTIRKFGSYRQDEAMQSLKPYTRNIVRQIGYMRICMSEAIQWERKEFMDLFRVNQERDEQSLMLDEPKMTLEELSRIARLKEEERLLLN